MRGPRDKCGVSTQLDHCTCAPPPPPPRRVGGFGDPHYVTIFDEHYSYQGVGVFSLVKGMYDGRPFEVQAYQCPCGGASCFSKLAISMNTSDPECTTVIGPVSPPTGCTVGGGLTLDLDDWGKVELTADGAYVTLPEDVRSSPELSGLLTYTPTTDERNGVTCSADSPLQAVPGDEVLFTPTDLDVASCDGVRSPTRVEATARVSSDFEPL